MISAHIIDLGDLAAANGMQTMKKREEDYVMQRHTHSISQQKSGRWKTRVGKGKARVALEANTYEGLIDKLFAYYTGLDAKEPTLRDGLEWLLDNKRDVQGVKPQTITLNRERFDRFTTPKLERTELTKVTDTMVCDSIRERCTEYENLHGKRLKLDGIRLYLQIISGIYVQAQKRGIIAVDPTLGLTAKAFLDVAEDTVRTAETKVMEPDDVDKLIAYCEANPCASAYAVRLSAYTGLRVGELCALQWSDVLGSEIHVYKQMTRDYTKNGNAHGYQIIEWTKNEKGVPRGGRYIPITPPVRALLSEVKQWQITLGAYSQGGFIFSRVKGVPLNRDAYIEYFRRTCKRCGIAVTKNHALRMHFNSYVLIPAGLTTPQRAADLGHRPETNERYYTWAGKSAREESAEKLIAFISKDEVAHGRPPKDKVV